MSVSATLCFLRGAECHGACTECRCHGNVLLGAPANCHKPGAAVNCFIWEGRERSVPATLNCTSDLEVELGWLLAFRYSELLAFITLVVSSSSVQAVSYEPGPGRQSMTSEEARQQAQAEELTLLTGRVVAKSNTTGY